VALDPSQKFGSLEEQMCLLARAFEHRGSLFLPLFLCPPGPGKTRQLEEAGVAAECLDLGRFRFRTLWQLLGLLRRQRLEVIHWNFSDPLCNGYVWWLTLLRPWVKHYFTDHNSRFLPLPSPASLLTRTVKRLLLKRYRKVVCVSRFVQDCLTRQRTWSNLHCCLHFINTSRFKPDAAVRTQLRRTLEAEGRFVLLTVAHLIPEKGVDVVLRALKALPQEIVLWVVGDGREAETLKALAHELGLGPRARFLGLQRNVAPYMQAADCFVCPSLWAEAASLVNLEANACGLPVVGSKIGGIPEYVADGETGLLFPPGDHVALAERVRRLSSSPQLWQQMSAAARTAAVERFSAERRLHEYLDLYRTHA
jgi:glycosyltransferase involved in cell wall biosynthesis